jgi:hypothetical protein
MDRWKVKELKQMELSGNKVVREFYEENGMIDGGKPDHKNPALQRYKNELKVRVDKELGSVSAASLNVMKSVEVV